MFLTGSDSCAGDLRLIVLSIGLVVPKGPDLGAAAVCPKFPRRPQRRFTKRPLDPWLTPGNAGLDTVPTGIIKRRVGIGMTRRPVEDPEGFRDLMLPFGYKPTIYT